MLYKKHNSSELFKELDDNQSEVLHGGVCVERRKVGGRWRCVHRVRRKLGYTVHIFPAPGVP